MLGCLGPYGSQVARHIGGKRWHLTWSGDMQSTHSLACCCEFANHPGSPAQSSEQRRLSSDFRGSGVRSIDER